MARYDGKVTQYDKNYDFYINVTYTQDIANNTTTINVEECIDFRYNSVNSNTTSEIKINNVSSGKVDKQFAWSGDTVGTWKTVELFSWSRDIKHNADGTCGDIPITASFVCVAGGNGPGTCSVTINLPIPTIPRVSGVSAPNGTIGKAIKIAVSRASTKFTHTLRYVIGAASGVIATGVTTSYTWTPDMELCNQITDAVSGELTISCTTYSGNTVIGSASCEITLAVPDNVRLVCTDGWAKVKPYNEDTKAKDIDAFVGGYSKADVDFDSTKISTAENYGAKIASYKVVYNAKTLSSPYRTGTLQAGTYTLTCYVYDTRGRYEQTDLTVTVLPYSRPTLGGISIYRCAGKDDPTASDEGAYLFVSAEASCSDLDGKNSVELTAIYQPTGGGKSDPIKVPPGGAIIGNGLIAPTSSYMVYLTATDALGNTADYDTKIPTQKTFLRAREDGRGMGLGKHPENPGLDLDWDIYLNGHTIHGFDFLDKIWPVNSIYISFDHVNPAEKFGGTWARIADGSFILGAAEGETIGETGGEATHKLTAAELPKHRHSISGDGEHSHTIGYDTDTAGGGGYASVHKAGATGADGTSPTSTVEDHNHGGYTGYIGSGNAHNNMPPYTKMSIWRRIA